MIGIEDSCFHCGDRCYNCGRGIEKIAICDCCKEEATDNVFYVDGEYYCQECLEKYILDMFNIDRLIEIFNKEFGTSIYRECVEDYLSEEERE